MIELACPACNRTTSIHEESLSIGIEVLCRECGSILSVDQIEPLVLTKLDLSDEESTSGT